MLRTNRRSAFTLVFATLLLAPAALTHAQEAAQDTAAPQQEELKKEIAAAEVEAANKPKEPNLLFNLAYLYHQDANYGKSVPLLERLTALQPENQDAQLLLGLDEFHARRPNEAIEALKKTVAINPRNNEANFYLGLSYMALDRKDEADSVFERMAAQVPDDVDELYFLIKGYTQISSSLLSRLVALGKDSYRAHQVRAEYFDLQHNPEPSIKEYEKAVEVRPNMASPHYALASAYYKYSGMDKAQAEFRRTIEILEAA